MPSILKHTPKQKTPFKILDFPSKSTAPLITPNFFLLQHHLTHVQLKLMSYFILTATSSGYIKINTELINKFINLSKLVLNSHKPTLQNSHKNQVSKKERGRISYNNVLRDIIYLIDIHAIIQLKPNSSHYLVNPVYSHSRHTEKRIISSKTALNNYIKLLNSETFTQDMLIFYAIDWYLNVAVAYSGTYVAFKDSYDFNDDKSLTRQLLKWWKENRHLYPEFESCSTMVRTNGYRK